jgi:hypothetical protein
LCRPRHRPLRRLFFTRLMEWALTKRSKRALI